MSLESFVAIVGAFGLGGIGGVLLRAEHERAERRRDHMINVAEEFLSAVEVAITAVRLAEHQIVNFDFDQTDSDRLVAAHSAAIDGLSEASRELRIAEAIAARFSLIYPHDTSSFLKGSERFKERVPTHAVIECVEQLLGTLELMLSNRAVPRQLLSDTWEQLGTVHGAFTHYANEAIWRRWYTPFTNRLRRG